MRRRCLACLAGAVLLPAACRHSCGESARARDGLHDRYDVPRDKPSGRGPLPETLGEPISPRAVPTTPNFDPAQPLPAPTIRPYTPEPIPVVPVEPLPPYKSKKELLLPDNAPVPLSKSEYAPSTGGLLMDPIVAVSKADLPDGLLQSPIAPPELASPVPMRMPGPADPPDSVPDRPAVAITVEAVPGFANVSSGRKPQPEGLKQLKDKGFTAFAYLHAANADVGATRELVEKAGLKFRSVPLSPDSLKADSAAFNDLLRDSELRPLYVADDDGIRAGSLWYVWFRTVDKLEPETAKLRAAKLGLKDADSSELQKQFWLAINALLANN